MLYEFNVYRMEVDNHIFWVAESKSLKGCVGQGETSSEAIRELEENEKEWIDTAKEFNIPIPPYAIKKPKTFSGKFSLRMSPYIHEKASEAAEFLGLSLNQYINDAVIHYNDVISNNYNVRVSDYDSISEETKIISLAAKRESMSNKFVVKEKELEEM